ncbi:hypothetical protein CEXT_707501 [Caerostris extrusa]|uniref:Uncharacterized protein n=1 Tax=Caerostris extrusa TaxID=172846 RepID=A0AAV4Y6V1_CAEEX|nr:hypothetical protein CEXT_707501 [Caerostris extrusa]
MLGLKLDACKTRCLDSNPMIGTLIHTEKLGFLFLKLKATYATAQIPNQKLQYSNSKATAEIQKWNTLHHTIGGMTFPCPFQKLPFNIPSRNSSFCIGTLEKWHTL